MMCKTIRTCSLFLLTYLISGFIWSAVASPFEEGLSDRTDYENFTARLSAGAFEGAAWWAGQRSLAHPAPCRGNPDFVRGCEDAKQVLAKADLRRRADPIYRQGWNSYVVATQSPTAPSSLEIVSQPQTLKDSPVTAATPVVVQEPAKETVSKPVEIISTKPASTSVKTDSAGISTQSGEKAAVGTQDIAAIQLRCNFGRGNGDVSVDTDRKIVRVIKNDVEIDKFVDGEKSISGGAFVNKFVVINDKYFTYGSMSRWPADATMGHIWIGRIDRTTGMYSEEYYFQEMPSDLNQYRVKGTQIMCAPASKKPLF